MTVMNELFFTYQIENDQAILSDQEASHCSQVLRKKVGEHIFFTNGLGEIYESEILEIQKKQVILRIIKRQFVSNNAHFSIAIGLLKNRDRMEWMIEKLVEIGVEEIFLITTEKSERTKINVDRFEKKAVAAMKQSLRAHLPKITQLSFDEVLLNPIQKKFIAHCQNGIKTYWTTNLNLPQEPTLLLIGPEGDFSDKEIQKALNHNFQPVDLGPNRLRTETAAIYAAARFY
jgi:16S rRNA (uracil1498-N3)-methyltransferase